MGNVGAVVFTTHAMRRNSIAYLKGFFNVERQRGGHA